MSCSTFSKNKNSFEAQTIQDFWIQDMSISIQVYSILIILIHLFFFEWTEKSRKIELNFVFIIGADFPTKWRVNCSIKTKLKTKTGKTTTNEWSAVHEISSKCTYRLCATEYLQWQRIQSTGRVYLKYPTSS